MLYFVLALIAVVAANKNHHHHDNNSTHFAQWLAHLEKSDQFKDMSTDDQDQFVSIVMAAESGPDALTKALDSLTLVKFLELIDELKPDDIVHLELYLAAHAQKAANPAKRKSGHGHGHHTDLSEALAELHAVQKIKKTLNDKDHALLIQILKAVNDKRLTEFIADSDDVELIFTLLSDLDKDLTLGLDKLLEAHLREEAAANITNPV